MIEWFVGSVLTVMSLQAPTPLMPASAWQLDVDPKGCQLSRRFGPPEAPITLSLRPWLTLPTTEIFLETATGPATAGAVRVNGVVAPGGYRSVRLPTSGKRVAFFTTDRGNLTADDKTLRITLDGEPDYVLVASLTAPVLKQLSQCEAEVRAMMKLPSLDLPTGATDAIASNSRDWITGRLPGGIAHRALGRQSLHSVDDRNRWPSR